MGGGVKKRGIKRRGGKEAGVKMRTPNRTPPSLQLLKTNANQCKFQLKLVLLVTGITGNWCKW